jgi:hypothetical protein
MGFLLFFFTVLPLGAQPMPPQLEKLLALQKKPFQEWSEQERDDMPRMMAQINREILLSEIPAEDREALRDVTVSIVSTEHLAPAWVKDRKIFLADRKAWGMIQHLVDGPEAESDLGHDLRLAAFAGPFLLVRWQERPDNRDASAARRDQLDALAGPDLAADASLLVDPAPVPGRLRPVRVTWEEEPDAVYVNGERIAPAQLRGTRLRVFGTQRIFALRKGRYAFAELGWARRSSPSSPSSDTAALVFHAPQPTAG